MIISSINRFTQKHGPVVFTLILVIIAIPFVFYGYLKPSAPAKAERPESIGTYFGEDLSYSEVAMRYGRAFRKALGSGSADQEKRMVNNIVDQMALLHEAKSEGLGEVSKDELIAKLAEMEYFATDGKFDFTKYSKFPEQMRVMFEEQTTDQIIIERLQAREQEVAASKVTDQAIREAFDKDNITYSISAVSYKNSDFNKAVKVEDAEIKTYYEENKENYRIPEKAIMSVVKFDGKDFSAQVKPTDEELTAYFDANTDKFVEVKASHILVKVAKDATAEAKAAKKKVIEAILAKVKAGEKFEDLAKASSECPSKDKGGDLGWFGKGKMVPAFDTKVFTMKKGEMSDVVETKFGFHIIRCDGVHDTFETAKVKVLPAYVSEQLPTLAGEAAVKFANKAYVTMEKNGNTSAQFAKVVKASKLAAFTTKPFILGSRDKVAGIPSNTFATDVKGLNAANPLSEAIAGNGNIYYVACFVEAVPSVVLPFETATDAKKSITTKLTADKAKALAEKLSAKALVNAKAAIDGGKKFTDIAGSLKFVEIKDFKATGYPQKLQAAYEVKKQLADKKVGDLFGPLNGYGGCDVVYVRAITPATDEDFAKEKVAQTTKMKEAAKREAWTAFQKRITEKANVSLIAPWNDEEVVKEEK